MNFKTTINHLHIHYTPFGDLLQDVSVFLILHFLSMNILCIFIHLCCIFIFRIFYYFWYIKFTNHTQETHKRICLLTYVRSFYYAYIHLFKKSRINSPRRKSFFHIFPFYNIYASFSFLFDIFHLIWYTIKAYFVDIGYDFYISEKAVILITNSVFVSQKTVFTHFFS